MDAYLILLRLIHIFAAVFWTGATLLLYGFLMPTIKATGPEGGKVMQRLAQQSRLPLFMSLSSLLSTLSGILLFWTASAGFQIGWMTSGPGLIFTIGGLAGIVTFVVGFAIMTPSAGRLGQLGKEIEAAAGPPAPAQMVELETLQAKLTTAGNWSAILLAIALIGMSIARYASF